jgi:hypothetical protein
MAVTRLKTKPNPTMKDLQAQNSELHDCLNVTSAQVAAFAKAMGVRLPTPEEIEAGTEPKVHRRLGGLRPWQAAAIAVPVITGAMTAYHVIEPAVVAFAEALHHALMIAH